MKPQSLKLVLEQRFVFDAAMTVTAASMADHSDTVDADAHVDHGAETASPPSADGLPHLNATPPDGAQSADDGFSGTPDSAQASGTTKQILFIDPRVDEFERLAASVAAGTEIVLLDVAHDGVSQISEVLSGRSGIDAVHIVSHGTAGALTIGSGPVNAAILASRADSVASWRDALSDDADILLYGCNIGDEDRGRAFTALLADLTGADVAVSTDPTGSTTRGGNWQLELRTGSIEALSFGSGAAIEGYDGLLATSTPPSAGGNLTAMDPTTGAAAFIVEDASPSAANIRLSGITLADPDGTTPVEIRIISVTGGTVQAADGSAITLGSSGTRIALAGGQVDLRFTPGGNRDTTASLSYVVVDPNDQTQNSAESTVAIGITAVNDAPVLSGSPTLDSIAEDVADSANPGTLVTTLLARSTVTDDDTTPAALRGVAVVGADNRFGTWQYSLDGGESWTAIGSRTDANALLLGADSFSRVRLVPGRDFHSTGPADTPTLTIRAWDRTTGLSGSIANIDATGGSTAFSSATASASINVVPVNDRPELTVAGTLILPSITEDPATNGGVTVGSFFTVNTAGDLVRDVDATPMGMAVTGTTGVFGAWQYSLDGGANWTTVGTVSNTAVLLLPDTARVRFAPGLNLYGDATITYRAWDQSDGAPGATVDPSTINATALSTGSLTGQMGITPVDDAPVLVYNAFALDERTTYTLKSTDLRVTDVDNISIQLVYRLEATPQHGELIKTMNGQDVVLGVGALFSQYDIIMERVKYRHTDGTNLASNVTDSFSFSVRDGAGEAIGAVAPYLSATVTIRDVNAAISFASTNISVVEARQPGDYSTVALGFNDADLIPELTTVTINSVPAIGTLRYFNTATGDWQSVYAGLVLTKAALDLNPLRFEAPTQGPEEGGPTGTSFQATVSDGRGSTDAKTITLTFQPFDDLPTLQASALAILEGQSTLIGPGTLTEITNAHLNVVDIDTARANALYTITGAPAQGAIYLDTGSGYRRLGAGSTFRQTDVDGHKVFYWHDGTEPDGNSATADDTLTVVMRNADGADYAVTATLAIHVTPVDDAPIPQVHNGLWIGKPTSGINSVAVGTGTLTATDADTTDAQVTFTVTGGMPAGTSFTVNGSVASSFTLEQLKTGAVGVNADSTAAVGSYTVSLNVADLTTTVPVTLTLHVHTGGGTGGTNTAPRLDLNRGLVVIEDNGQSIQNAIGNTLLLAEDAEQTHGLINYTVVQTTTHGALLLNGTALRVGDRFTQADIDNGLVKYVNDGSENSTDFFRFTIDDGVATSVIHQFDIVITPVNDAPTVTQTLNGDGKALLALSEGTGAEPEADFNLAGVVNAVKITTAQLLGSDVDVPVQPLTYIIERQPPGGTIKVWNGTAWVAAGNSFSAADVADGKVAYFHNADREPNPANDYMRVYLIDFASNLDGSQSKSGTATVWFGVSNVNDAPRPDAGSFKITEGGTKTLDATIVGATDSDNPVTDFTYRITTLPTYGTIAINHGDGRGFIAVTALDVQNGTADARFTRDDLINGRVRYTHNGSEDFSDSLGYMVSDLALESTTAGTVSITITPLNDAPSIDRNVGLTVYEGETATIVGMDTLTPANVLLGISDPDNTEPLEVQIRIETTVTRGWLIYDNGTTTRTLGNGSAFTLDDLRKGYIRYRHSGSETTSDIFYFSVSDSSGDPAEPRNQPFVITILPVNDSPTAVVPNSASGLEDTPFAVTGVTVGDIEVGAGTMRVTLSVTHGTLSIGTLGSASFVNGTANGQAVIELQGSVAALNAALATLTYTGSLNYVGPDTLTVTASDLGGSGADPSGLSLVNTPATGDASSQTVTKTVALTVNPVNDAPEITGLDNTPTFVEDGSPVVLDGNATLSDVELDAVGNWNGATLSVRRTAGANAEDVFGGSGTLILAGDNSLSVDGVQIGTFTNTGGVLTLTFNGNATTALVSSALQKITYSNTNDNPPATVALSVIVSDGNTGAQGAGGSKSAIGSITVSITPHNDAIAITAPTTVTGTETTSTAGANTVLTFSASDLISINEVDEGAISVHLVLSKSANSGTGTLPGALHLSTTTGVTVTAGANGTAEMTIQGTATAINAALNGLVMKLGPDDFGRYTLTVEVDDLGNGGTGGSSTGTKMVDITIRSVNDAPTLQVGSTTLGSTPSGNSGALDAFVEDAGWTVVAKGGTPLTVADSDVAENSGAVITVTIELTGTPHGQLRVNLAALPSGVAEDTAVRVGGASALQGGWFTSARFTGTQAEINQLLAALQYQGNANFNTSIASETLRLTVNDLGNSFPVVGTTAGVGGPETGGANIVVRDIPLTVSPRNDAPTLGATTTSHTLAENSTQALGAFTLGDVDLQGNTAGNSITVTVTVNGQPGNNDTIAIGTLANVTLAVLTGSRSGNTITGTPSFTLTGTRAAVEAALSSLTYGTGDDPKAATTITVIFDDKNNEGPAGDAAHTATETITINVTPANDAPVLTTPASVNVNEDNTYTFTGSALKITDPDSRSERISLTISVTAGTFRLSADSGLSTDAAGMLAYTRSFTGSVTVYGTVGALNTALSGLVYKPDTDANSKNQTAPVLSLSVSDLGHGEDGHAGTPLNDAKSVTINIAAVNDAPTLTKPSGTVTVQQDDAAGSVINGISVDDAKDKNDAGYGNVKLTLSVLHGTLQLVSTPAGLTVTGNGSSANPLVLTGTLADINAALGNAIGYTDNLRYVSDTNYSGSDTLSLTFSDEGQSGSGGAKQATGTVPLSVTGENDPPTLTGGTVGGTYVENDTVGIAVAQSFVVGDPDALNFGGGFLRVGLGAYVGGDVLYVRNVGTAAGQIGVSGGTVTYGGTTIGTVDATETGNSTSIKITLSVNASKAAVQALLAQVYFKNTGDNPTDYGNTASREVTVHLDDGGNTGSSGGAKNVEVTGTITVTPQNDAPTVVGATVGAAFVENGGPVSLVGGTITVADLDALQFNGGSLTVALNGYVAGDVLAVSAGGTITVSGSTISHNGNIIGTIDTGSNGAGTSLVITFTSPDATPAAVAALLARLTYDNTGDNPTNAGAANGRAVTITLNDGGRTGPTAQTAVITGTITYTTDNDAPTIDGGTAGGTYTEAPTTTAGTALLTGYTLQDKDAAHFNGGSVTVTLDAYRTGDTLFVNSQGSTAGLIGYDSTTRAVSYGGIQIGTVHATSNGAGASLVITLNANATPAGVQALLHQIQFRSTSYNPTVDGSDTDRAFTLTFSDGGNVGGVAQTATVTGTITVVALNNQPTLTGSLPGSAYTEGQTSPVGTAITTGLTVGDLDLTTGSSSFNGGSLRVAFAAYQIGDLLFVNNQGSGAGQVGFDAATGAVTVGGVQIGTLDSTVGGSGTDLLIHLNANATAATVQTLLAEIRYRSSSEDPAVRGTAGTRAITVTLDDGGNTGNGGAKTATATGTLTVTSVNDAPGLGSFGGTVEYVEGSSTATVLNGLGSATVSDAELAALNGGAGDWGGAVLTVRRQGTANAQDVFSGTGTLVLGGGTVTLGGATVGSFTQTAGTLAITFAAGTTNAQVQGVLDRLGYSNSSLNTDQAGQTVTIQAVLNDGNTGAQGTGGALDSVAATVSVTVRPVNSAPALTASAGATAFQEPNNAAGSTAAVAVDGGFTLTDADSTTLAQATLSISGHYVSGQDVLAFTNTSATTYGNIAAVWDAATGALTLSSAGRTATVAQWQAALRAVTYHNLSDTPDTADRMVSVVVDDGQGTANGGASAGTAVTRTVTVAAANDSPVLDSAVALTLHSPAEDSAAPAGAVGTLVSALVGTGTGPANVADPDAPGLGIAITGLDTGKGDWYVSLDGGTTWSKVTATLSETNALHLAADASTRVYFHPTAADYNGTIANALTFRAWDGHDGTANGALASTGTSQGTGINTAGAAHSAATRSLSITVGDRNDAPILTTAAPVLVELTEDDVTNDGQTVASIVGTSISHLDAGEPDGIAITGTVDGTGRWQFSTDGGATWTDAGTVSESSALLLRSTDLIRFVPDTENGTTGSFTYRAWDQSAGTAGGRGDASVTGGATTFSTVSNTASIVATDVNDAPVLTAAAPTLPAMGEDDAAGPGTTVADILGLTVADVDTGAVQGIAVTAAAVTGGGVWQYSIDGGTTWAGVGTVSESGALLLRSTDLVRFIPDGIQGGSATLTYRAWDRTSGSAGDRVDTSVTGGTTAFSVVTDTLGVTVSAVNDPLSAAQTIGDQTTPEDSPYSHQVPASLFTDIDPGDTVTFSATLADDSPLPSWLSFDPATRTFSGTPLNEHVGSYAIRVAGTDSGGSTASVSFTLTVVNVNDAPTLTNPLPAQTAAQSAGFTYQVPANGFDDVDVGDQLTYTARLADGQPLPSWLSFDPATRTFTGTPGNTDVGSLSVVVIATDLAGATATGAFTITIANVNDAPTVATAITDQVTPEDSPFTFQIPSTSFADIDPGDRLTYTATLADGGPLPAWLSFDPATGTFTGTPLNEHVGTLSLRVMATDSAGASVSTTFGLTVVNVNDAPTVAGGPDALSATEGLPLSLTVDRARFGDVDVGDRLTFTATLADGSALPAWLSFDAATLTISGTPPAGSGGTVALVLRATDLAGASATLGIAVNIATPVVTAPVTPPADPTPVPPVVTPAPPPTPTTPAADTPVVVAPNTPTGANPTDTLITTVPPTSPSPLFTNSDTQIGQTSPNSVSPIVTAFTDIVGAGTPGTATAGFGADAVLAASSLNRRDNSGALLSTDALFLQSATANVDLFLAGSVGNQIMLPQQQTTFQVPPNIFRHTNPSERLVYQAVRPDGSPLPNWLQFDAQNLTFRGTPPTGVNGAVDIVIVAKDGRGNRAAAQFRILVAQDLNERTPGGDQQPPPAEAPPEPVPEAPADAPQPPPEPPAPQQRADAGAPAEPSGRSSFTAQVHAAGRPGLLAEARALLDTLLAAADVDRDAA